MKRATVAFLIAPLWMPAAMLLLIAVRQSRLPKEIWIAAPIFYAVIAYGVMLAVGLPLYRRFRGRGAFWRIVAIGSAASVVLVVFYLLALFTMALATHRWELLQHLSAKALSVELITVVAMGALVGATWWAIARPDRSESPAQHF